MNLNLLKQLFHQGLKYKEIQHMLANRHGIYVSIRHMKRLLSNNRLYRRKNYSDVSDVVHFIVDYLTSAHKLNGYRWVYSKCINEGLRVTYDLVRQILLLIDPQAVDLRKARRFHRRSYFAIGPNFIWHLDGYDKLKPFGICIHGCIDGFSRKIIWLKAATTNNDPSVIASYYINAVVSVHGCPKIIRGDFGTENVRVAAIQRFFRRNGADDRSGHASYIDGASTCNQRIESWWGILRKHCTNFWIQFFNDLKDEGHFDGSFLDKSLIQFSFMSLIQDQLDDVSETWNSHHIRPSRNSHAPRGRPNILFSMPELCRTVDCLEAVSDAEVRAAKGQFVIRVPSVVDSDIFSICCYLVEQQGLILNSDVWSQLQVYLTLRSELKQLGL